MNRLKNIEKISKNKFVVMKMNELGIKDGYTGYYYLVDILDLLVNRKIVVNSFYKDVYPVVASMSGKGSCTVERDIRNLIDHIWAEELNPKMAELWPHENKPSCCKFIYLIKNYIVKQIV